MEHVQPLNRTFPWRLATLMASALALAVLAGLVLTHGPGRTRPVAATGRVSEGPALPPPRPRAQISVLVLNGNGASGAAGNAATGILARGYRHAIPADAPNLAYVRSVVLFRRGWESEAERLARDAKIPTVAPLDGRVAARYARVPLIVILGANQPR